jgi:hypothetical protein
LLVASGTVSRIPRPDAAEPFGSDPGDPARLIAQRLGWKDRPRAEVEVRETLEQSGGTAFGDPPFATHNQILLEPERVPTATEAGEHDAGVSLYVPHLLMETHVAGGELVVLDTHPHDRDLWAAVAIERR